MARGGLPVHHRAFPIITERAHAARNDDDQSEQAFRRCFFVGTVALGGYMAASVLR
ncbi:hypothetical protein [Burkholderia ubonensis]|uniref:hypothetical protein n=1 Tax=Burkholderia ubonensis TaxID=101571 RepID=UPI001FC818D9|nr:hypothetical protein [Burkholderia ubonensis]